MELLLNSIAVGGIGFITLTFAYRFGWRQCAREYQQAIKNLKATNDQLSAAIKVNSPASVEQINITKRKWITMAKDLSPNIADLQAINSVEQAELAYIANSAARQEAAVAADLEGGATEAQLQPLLDNIAIDKAAADQIAAAIVANTPAAPAAPEAPAAQQ